MEQLSNNPVINRKRGKKKIKSEFTDVQMVKGITFFLYDRGFKDLKDAHLIIKHYCHYNKIILPDIKPIVFACKEIQKDFPDFLIWTNKYYPGTKQEFSPNPERV